MNLTVRVQNKLHACILVLAFLQFLAISAVVCRAQESEVRLASSVNPASGFSYINAETKPDSKSAMHGSDSAWPIRFTQDQFSIYSTVSLLTLEPHLAALRTLPNELRETLQIEVADSPVHIVVLSDRESLDQYAKKILPNAPSRQALYIRHRGPGLVLTYFHKNWIRDVRHECTHALMDASGMSLPVWQDEGLAEYFETVGGKPLRHPSHLKSVQQQIRFGQIVDLQTIETTEIQEGLDGKGYRDAWSVVAFLLHSSAETRAAYQLYLKEHQTKQAAGLLSHRVRDAQIDWRSQFAAFYRNTRF
jgi:hypothetical protein